MVDIVNLAQLREQVRLEVGDTTQDAILETISSAAMRAIENRTGRCLQGIDADVPEADLPIVRQAVLMIAAHWFDNRDLAGQLPAAVEWLLLPLAKLAI